MHGTIAYRVFLIEAGASAFFRTMIYTALTIYYVRSVGLDPLQLVLVGTILEATCFVFQIPTGVIADVYSRRLSVVIGVTLVGVCFLIEGAIPLFSAILLAEVIRGIGETCIDGALQAWVADEVGEEALDRVYFRGGQVSAAARLVAPFAGVGLATVDYRLPVLLGGSCLVLLGLFLAVAMPETGFTPAPRSATGSWRTSIASMSATVREANVVIHASPILAILLAVALVGGASSEGFDRLWEAHFLIDLTLPDFGGLDPILWFGVINAVGAVLGIVGAQIAMRHIDTRRDRETARLLMIGTGAASASVVVFGLAGSFPLAIAAFWFGGLVHSLTWPVAGSWLNRQIDGRVRATVLSAHSQANALGQLAGGPAIGAVGSIFSIRVAIALCGLVLTPAMLLYGMAMKRDREIVVAPVAEVHEVA